MNKEIGGYFGLDINGVYNNIGNTVALNSARNCLRYAIRALQIKEIFIPFYTCPVVWQSIKKENCKISFYHIDNDFLPTINFPKDAYILYTNYFGICAKNVKNLAQKYKNLIVDNAQAFYMPSHGIASFNSIRKFFGTPDGALLNITQKLEHNFDKDTSYQRCSHLLKRIDINAQFGYEDFCHNDESLRNEDIKTISNLTSMIFNSINIEDARQKRLSNFEYLHKNLEKTNLLKFDIDSDDVPMVYPYLIKNDKLKSKLIKNKIYVATYWDPQPIETQEGIFQKYLLPLPLDQRYNNSDMQKILEVIND